MKKIESIYVFIISIIIYRLLLDYIYIELISEVYGYSGFLNEQTNFSYNSSWILLLIFTPFMFKIIKMELFSSNVMFLLFLISFVPTSSLMRFMPMDNTFFLIYSIFWLALIFYYFVIPKIGISKKSFKTKISVPLWLLLVIFCLSIIFISGYYHGFRFTIDISDVYVFRDEEKYAGYPTIFGYIIPAASNVLPLFLVYFLMKKNYFWSIFISVVLIFLFSTGGHKSVLFKLFLAFFGYIYFNYKSFYKYSWTLISLIILCVIEFKTISTFFITNFVVRRALFLPAKLNYDYYDFFTKNSSDYYLQGPLRRFGFESEYNSRISNLIGQSYYDSIDMGANNGLFSDAYANLNVLGVFILPLILVLIFKLGDSVSFGLPGKLMFLPIISFVFSFNSGFFTSVLLTNGIVLMMISLYYYPRFVKSKSVQSC